MNSSINDLASALDIGINGEIEEWVHEFLCNEGDNIPFSEGLKLEKRYFYGPLKMKLEAFSRCCGPEDEMTYTIDEDDFERNVSRMMHEIESGWDMPPLIVNYAEGAFVLSDGNHRYEALLRSSINEYYFIVWITGMVDQSEFITRYHECIELSK